MNALEIARAISDLADQPFDPDRFPFAFLEAVGSDSTGISKQRFGSASESNTGGLLQAGIIHIKVAEPGSVAKTMDALRDNVASQGKRPPVKFIMATDGEEIAVEDLATSETVACTYKSLPNHFSFFLPLAGIAAARQMRKRNLDIQAASLLTRLFFALLQENPDWETAERGNDMNRFLVNLIFCFFAEDISIFSGNSLFTATVAKMSEQSGANTHDVINEVFRAMSISSKDRKTAKIPRWANNFPYVNGWLQPCSINSPRFDRSARQCLLDLGDLDWTRINPDIFGSVIQSIADANERGALGLHYTSVPNILKALDPLFLDELRTSLEAAGHAPRKLANLRKRMSKIRLFDPACGSGNFLVFAYKEIRAIEAEINLRCREADRPTNIPLTNFRGIEIHNFSAEIARLALIVAERQCDTLFRGRKEAKDEFSALKAENWITCGNALRLDWSSICPTTGNIAKAQSDDLFGTMPDQSGIRFEHERGETYICGNPPYLGQAKQNAAQKHDVASVLGKYTSKSGAIDYAACWLVKAAEYNGNCRAPYAFVTTNSLWQGQQVAAVWPVIRQLGGSIFFAYPSIKWNNLATRNAGVIVSIVGIDHSARRDRRLYEPGEGKAYRARKVPAINAYLAAATDVIVSATSAPNRRLSQMHYGNQPRDGGHLCLTFSEVADVRERNPSAAKWIRGYVGSHEMIRGLKRGCVWIPEDEREEALAEPYIAERVARVAKFRASSKAASTRSFAEKPHRFVQIQGTAKRISIAISKVSSERREYIPAAVYDSGTILSDLLFGIYDAPIWNFAFVASRIHMVWAATVCGKLKTDYRYSNTLGWNTFPVPALTEKNRADLTCCAEDILLAREAHFPSTIADLYDPDSMPEDLRAAHDRNDEALERIYIGRRFKNDTERLEKLFELHANEIWRIEAARA